MTFRIDRTELQKSPMPNQWHWLIKGYQGRGIYCHLFANPGEPGLYVERDIDIPEDTLIDRDLLVTEAMTPDQADDELRKALARLAWGPEVKDGYRR